MAIEIERKFLARVVGPIPEDIPRETFQQGYLVTGDPELRIRVSPSGAFMAVKAGAGLRRTEVEVRVSLEDGEQLLALCGACRVVKTRYHIGRWELDIFHEQHDGLVMMEQELPHVAEYRLDPTPPFVEVVREVTADALYTNKHLAARAADAMGPAGPRYKIIHSYVA